ncbi:hypothetical protein [Xanthomonas euvesicatoria]|uniref:hypothetical protein n=1 Tax=Xanthomonas euvesicatoria TaxID=456327 RepID=UPI0010572D9D|nr:hypothetical protein [Xanthomonas euvesicatoria]MBV6777435.1 hypothetical protein [Xanthomonas campestris pv. carissae]
MQASVHHAATERKTWNQWHWRAAARARSVDKPFEKSVNSQSANLCPSIAPVCVVAAKESRDAATNARCFLLSKPHNCARNFNHGKATSFSESSTEHVFSQSAIDRDHTGHYKNPFPSRSKRCASPNRIPTMI